MPKLWPGRSQPSASLSSFAAVLLVTAACVAAAAFAARTAIHASAPPEQPNLPPFDTNTSLLVVSPHPDDESLCCAGVIQRVLKSGGRASVVWITSGDGSELDLIVVEKSLFTNPDKLRDLALRRMEEARAAAKVLGIPAEQQFFLGYPDRGLLNLITDNYITPYRSKYTGASSVPYPNTLSPGHPYTGQNLEQDFESVLDRVQPTLILAPSPEDLHPDHRASGILTIRALSRRQELSKVRYWIVHGGPVWPRPRGLHLDRSLTPAPRSRGLAPVPFLLDPAEEQRKLEAVRTYQTQMEVMSSYLLGFVRTNELFSSIPVPDRTAGVTSAGTE